MQYFYKLFITVFLSFFFLVSSFADEKTAFINIEYIIQNSNIGQKVLNGINDLNKKNIDKLEKKNIDLKELEVLIKNKKNIISDEEFNNEVKAFQKKVQDLTKEKDIIVKEFNKYRKEELEKILSLFNPIISNYMNENSVNILIDSKNIFMGSTDSNLTEDILKRINDEIK